MEVKAASM